MLSFLLSSFSPFNLSAFSFPFCCSQACPRAWAWPKDCSRSRVSFRVWVQTTGSKQQRSSIINTKLTSRTSSRVTAWRSRHTPCHFLVTHLVTLPQPVVNDVTYLVTLLEPVVTWRHLTRHFTSAGGKVTSLTSSSPLTAASAGDQCQDRTINSKLFLQGKFFVFSRQG